MSLYIAPALHGRSRVVDALNIPHRSKLLPALDAPLDEWAADRAMDRSPRAEGKKVRSHNLTSINLDYFWAPCAKDQGGAARAVSDGGNWSHVVLFAPAYWHLTGSCGKKQLNATAEGVMQVWAPWLRLNQRSTRYSLINVPVENVPAAWQATQQALNGALAAQFAASAFPQNWRLIDWAAYTLRMRLPTVVPHGDQKRSWHYICQLYRQVDWYTMRDNHPPAIMTRAGLGDCGDVANTALWQSLVLDEPLQSVKRLHERDPRRSAAQTAE